MGLGRVKTPFPRESVRSQDRLGLRPGPREPSRRLLLEAFWRGSVSLPCGPSSCRTGARPSRDAGAWLVGLHQGAAAQLRADAHAPIAESAALALSCTAI